MTDQEFAAAIAAGHREALESLVKQYHRPVLRYLWHAGGSREDAEDLATQTLLRVRADACKFRAEGTLRAWIFQIAYRELLRHRRRQSLSHLVSRAKGETLPPNEDAIVLSQALGTLPLKQRTPFLLVEVEELSVEEAAKVLGIPPGTVKSRCHHARLRLRKLLGPTYGEPHAEPAID